MTTSKFKISGMHCVSCSMNIDFALEDLPGIKSATTNYAKSLLTVEFEENKVSKKEIVSQIKSLGYTASDSES
jgi:copper chaperone CopZ